MSPNRAAVEARNRTIGRDSLARSAGGGDGTYPLGATAVNAFNGAECAWVANGAGQELKHNDNASRMCGVQGGG
ncbi:hypothetical protein K523DRAFT_359156 [Schizophyllum commune Tattone D]|nr:hypothetical protein K523DRAFT_359156 [Schizophyllum commune Tattone D]